MKNTIFILSSLILILFLCSPAFGDPESDNQGVSTSSDTSDQTVYPFLTYVGSTSSDTTVQKEETVTEETSIVKDVEIGISQEALPVAQSGGASSQVGVDTTENTLTQTDNDNTATIEGFSFNNVEGITTVNQAPGSMNNQGNSISVSFVEDGDDTLLSADVAYNQSSSKNTVNEKGTTISNTIKSDAFNTLTGIAGINQSAGNLNSQNNIIALSIGGNPVVSLSPAELGAISGSNTVVETGISKTDTIRTFAFERVSGIVSINQSSGSMNNQVNVINISVNNTPF